DLLRDGLDRRLVRDVRRGRRRVRAARGGREAVDAPTAALRALEPRRAIVERRDGLEVGEREREPLTHRLVVRAGDPAEAAHRAERLADLVGEALERAGGVAVLDQGGEVSDAPGAAVGGFAGRAALFDEAR